MLGMAFLSLKEQCLSTVFSLNRDRCLYSIKSVKTLLFVFSLQSGCTENRNAAMHLKQPEEIIEKKVKKRYNKV